MLWTQLKYKELEKWLLIFIQMNFPPQTSWFLIVGASSEGGLHRPLAANTKNHAKWFQLKIILSVKAGYLVANLGGDEELLHGHVVHGWEVLHSMLLATVPPVWEENKGSTYDGSNLCEVTLAEVLLEVDDVLGNHDGVLDVGLNPLQPLDALLTCVPSKSRICNFFNVFTFSTSRSSWHRRRP